MLRKGKKRQTHHRAIADANVARGWLSPFPPSLLPFRLPRGQTMDYLRIVRIRNVFERMDRYSTIVQFLR